MRSHAFDDYTDRGIISYQVRQALSALKSIYQEASVSLALPESPADGKQGREGGNRAVLRDLVGGLEVNWDGRKAKQWREAVRLQAASPRLAAAAAALSGPLDREGLIVAKTDPGARQKVAVPFAVFHHMPTPKRDDLAVDPDTLLDFHQALSALNSYPELLRALGLVFDVGLPRDFVAETPQGIPGTLSVRQATPGWGWSPPPAMPPLATAYLHWTIGSSVSFSRLRACSATRGRRSWSWAC